MFPPRIASVALLLAVATAQERRPRAPEPDVRNEAYGPHERNVFDLWKADSEEPTPLVVYIHGGGFRGGSKSSIQPRLIADCRARGISVAAIHYRLSQHAPFPAPMHDSARAIQHMRHHAKRLGLDPKRIACTGGSAGAGISLWLAFHDDLADPKSDDPVLRESTRISCALPTNGQCSYDPRFIQEHVGGRAHEHPALRPFYGLDPKEWDTEKAHALFAEASPITHLTADDPPVLMIYGGNDEPSDRPGKGIHSEKFGIVLQREMRKLGIESLLQVGRRRPEHVTAIEFFAKHLE